MNHSGAYPHLSEDAAVVLALAETAVSFAVSAEDEAERWVRILRLQGEVGCALQALGVPEGPLESTAASPAMRDSHAASREEDVVDLVRRRAVLGARARESQVVGTVHVLYALIETYGGILDRALSVRGTTRQELLDCLAERTAARTAERTLGLP